MLQVRLSPGALSDSLPNELNRRLQRTPTTAKIGRGEGERGGGGETQLADWAMRGRIIAQPPRTVSKTACHVLCKNDEAEVGGMRGGEEEDGGGGGGIFFRASSAEAAD